MTVNSLLNSYRSALPSSSGSSWPADGRDIDTATATSLTVNGTSVTLDRFDGYTLDTEGAYPIVVSNPIRLRLELWGGGGGGSSGGAAGSAGGWIAGDMVLSAGTYWLLVAGGGVYSTGLPAFPDSSTTSESSGGGSSRFGPASTYLTANQVHTKGNGFNNSNAVYWLIAGGGGGGSNHATTEDTPGRGGEGNGGGFCGTTGHLYYGAGESGDSCGTGGGQSYGGKTGTAGRLNAHADGDGLKYYSGRGSGAGGGGGYYGGAGARGYYATGGGGSSYYDPDYVRNVSCRFGGRSGGVENGYRQAIRGFRGKPHVDTGDGGTNTAQDAHGHDGGARLSLWVPNGN